MAADASRASILILSVLCYPFQILSSNFQWIALSPVFIFAIDDVIILFSNKTVYCVILT